MLSCNVGEIFTILLGTFLGGLLFKEILTAGGNIHILSAIQILWVNLVTDSLMAIALGLDPKNPDIMDQKPRDKNEGIFSGGLGRRIILQGLMWFIVFCISYWL